MPQVTERGTAVDRDEFFAQLDQLTPKEMEARLSSWDRDTLLLVQEYFAKQSQPKAPQTDHPPPNVVTERTVVAALIALGLVVAALILRGGCKLTASTVGAYLVNRFAGRVSQCLSTCVRLPTFLAGLKEKLSRRRQVAFSHRPAQSTQWRRADPRRPDRIHAIGTQCSTSPSPSAPRTYVIKSAACAASDGLLASPKP